MEGRQKRAGDEPPALFYINLYPSPFPQMLYTNYNKHLVIQFYHPEGFWLFQNYPNPFTPPTTIKYAIPSDERVEIIIYNTLGQKVRTLVNRNHQPGYYKVVWDATNDAGVKVGSGIFFSTVKAGKHNAVKKMVLIK